MKLRAALPLAPWRGGAVEALFAFRPPAAGRRRGIPAAALRVRALSGAGPVPAPRFNPGSAFLTTASAGAIPWRRAGGFGSIAGAPSRAAAHGHAALRIEFLDFKLNEFGIVGPGQIRNGFQWATPWICIVAIPVVLSQVHCRIRWFAGARGCRRWPFVPDRFPGRP